MSDLGPFADMEEEGGGNRRILLFAVFGLAGVLLLGALALLGFVVISMLSGGGEPAPTPTAMPTNTAQVLVVTPRVTTAPTTTPTTAPTTAPTTEPGEQTPAATESAGATTPTQASQSTPAPTANPNEPTATPKSGVPDTGIGDVALLVGAGLGLVVLLLLLRTMRTRERLGMP